MGTSETDKVKIKNIKCSNKHPPSICQNYNYCPWRKIESLLTNSTVNTYSNSCKQGSFNCLVLILFQALSMLLNGTPFVFVIDLAALASRREYLKLDKWVKDKLKEHQVI